MLSRVVGLSARSAAAARWCGSILGGLLVAGSAIGDPLLPNLDSSFFPIGAYYQPARASGTTSFTGWKARGVNTLIGWEQQAGGATSVSVDEYSAAAVNAGLLMIREPRADPAADIGQANLLGWMQPDEPEGNGIPATILQSNYAQWRAAWSAATSAAPPPVLVNFDGSRVIQKQAALTQADYAPYVQAADWVSQDIYPVTGWLQPDALQDVGRAVSTLSGYANGKPGFAVIETSNQHWASFSHPEWDERGVTPGEFRVEVWDAIIHGARGIVYFPQAFNGFRYDATPIDIANEMTKQNAAITGLGGALNSTATPDATSISFSNGGSLEYITRTYQGVTYLIVLNTSDAQVQTDLSPNFAFSAFDLKVLGEGRDLISLLGNSFNDTFDPYGMHVYAEVPTGLSALDVPEPTGVLLPIAAFALLMCRRRAKASMIA